MTLSTPSTLHQQDQIKSKLPIAQRFKQKSQNYKLLLAKVLEWTGGQPALTQTLCQLIADAEDAPAVGAETEWFEQLVHQKLIDPWENLPTLEPMRAIRDRLTMRKQRSAKLLQTYQKILEQGAIAADDSPEQKELRLLGLVSKQQDQVEVHNPIYAAAFNQTWLDQALKKIQSEIEPSDAVFRKTLAELERKLLLSQIEILSRVDNGAEEQKSAQTLYEVLRDVTSQVGDLVSADRASIFLLNDEKTELWSLVAENEAGDFLDIRVRIGEGIAGQVAQAKKVIHIPANVYDDPRAVLVKEFDQKYGYKTENILALPILSETKEVVAVIQFLNKLQAEKLPDSNEAIKPTGFTKLDLERLAKCLLPIRRILESCQSCYKAVRKLQATAALAEATRSLDQINLDTKAILQRVMNTAKKLMNADRSTLWLVDHDQGDLWTEIPGRGEVRCAIGVGFAGYVALTREPMIIPFDLYDHPSAENAKKTDEQTRYRTCSLLCMPVISPEGELLGVTQLVNKRKPGNHPEYSKDDWPTVPDYFKTGFDRNDQQAMQVFNERVGVVLQFVKTHETLKQLGQVKPKEAIYNALSVLSSAVADQDDEALHNVLYHVLSFVSQSLSKLLKAEFTTIFLLDAEETEFWSLNLGIGGDASEIRISATLGIAHKILETRATQASHNPQKFNDVLIYKGVSPDKVDGLLNLLLFPVIDQRGKVIAIIRAFNKLQLSIPGLPLEEKIDPRGFSKSDSDYLKICLEPILPILQACRSFHEEILTIQEQQRALDPLYQAISFVSQSSGNPEELIQKVMQAAKNLTHADRSTLWLIDHRTNELWTSIRQSSGAWLETRVPIGEGFVGKVAQTGQALNIPFDLYNHPDSEMARKTDQKTRYRTCSLLCMPVLGADGELLGVTQLVNKRRPGNFPEYSAADWPDVPDYLKSSFEEKDQKDMEIFNNQVGVILPEVINRQRSSHRADSLSPSALR
ncbi:GAF domain-containing protein [Leptolyngbya sp. FACHB-671]|uniref:GAF domain-containing protein n=1 Tax=Leptolyngbya sp. FACHB-671 TaxID=2692812 RepID=UPI0016846E9E|nr:GAF domain-containing protein [Leptolyngbya sp. FACHB-671]MBD2071794.1 GAF domain-containing protein [Leptolyngbya sp. FACHB-671]